MNACIDDVVLMGMGVESVRVDGGRFEIFVPGVRVTLSADNLLTVRQRIGADRQLLSCRLSPHLAPWRLALQTPFRCMLAGNGLDLTVQGDSVLIFSPQQHMRLAFEGSFRPQYSEEVRGNRLLLDQDGGCGFYGFPARPTELEKADTPSWALKCHLNRWDELWVSLCPPRPENRERMFQSIAHEGELVQAPYPSNEVIRDAARFCQIFTVHSGWEVDAPEWSDNPPGANYPHPRPWETDRHAPADAKEFARVRDEAHRLGMKFIPYLSPFYSNAPDIFAEMERVLAEYGVDGLYFDGWVGHQDDFRQFYRMIRRARAILGDRILYLHSSSEPYGSCKVYPPFVFAYTDFLLGGEAGRFGLELEKFVRYIISQHQISNSVGMWCHYGSWSDEPGYHSVVPSPGHVEVALRNHARFWRTGRWWMKESTAEELARFDGQYYGALARLRSQMPGS